MVFTSVNVDLFCRDSGLKSSCRWTGEAGIYNICYKFVGYVSLQELMPTASYNADLRQGVGIKYITEPTTA